jgi:Uma2 family endonuclease
MAALPNLITVAEFRQLPEGGDHTYELHYGEVVRGTRPRMRHIELQYRLLMLLGPRLQAFGAVRTEFPYRLFEEFDLRAADVAAISRERFDTIDPDDNLRGAPELVIEVKSPSNTPSQLKEMVAACLTRGAVQCWIVDPAKRSVTLMNPDGVARIFAAGDSIPLDAFGGGTLAVDEIFA